MVRWLSTTERNFYVIKILPFALNVRHTYFRPIILTFWNMTISVIVITKRPASADRTARRQFQATGQPVSRTQASDAMTSRLPRYEAKYVCNAGASNAGRSLCVQISRELSYPLPIYWYHSKGNWLRYNAAADSFYIMKLCSRRFVLYCRNCPKDNKFRRTDGRTDGRTDRRTELL